MFCGLDSCYRVTVLFVRCCLSWLYVFVGISTICHVLICILSCGQGMLLGAFVVIVEVTSVLRLRMDLVPEITYFLYFWNTRRQINLNSIFFSRGHLVVL